MGEERRNDDLVVEWESGLPSAEDLTPLSQSLIPPELASAFRISQGMLRSMFDVNRASEKTLSSLRCGSVEFDCQSLNDDGRDQVMVQLDDEDRSDQKRSRRMDTADNFTDEMETEAEKSQKRPRLVWTPQLHKRFVEVVAYLGLKNAVPKTIMQMMNVEGLTRENVASHLQKYRLYVKRMQGLSNEGPSQSDHLFSSTPVPPHSFNESSSNGDGNFTGAERGNGRNGNKHVGMPIPVIYPPPPQIVPMPLIGMPGNSASGFNGYELGQSYHHHFQQQHNSVVNEQRDWSGRNLK